MANQCITFVECVISGGEDSLKCDRYGHPTNPELRKGVEITEG